MTLGRVLYVCAGVWIAEDLCRLFALREAVFRTMRSYYVWLALL